MSEPTEIEKKLESALNTKIDLLEDSEAPRNTLLAAECDALRNLLDELVERRLRAEYLGQSSITGRNPHEERID